MRKLDRPLSFWPYLDMFQINGPPGALVYVRSPRRYFRKRFWRQAEVVLDQMWPSIPAARDLAKQRVYELSTTRPEQEREPYFSEATISINEIEDSYRIDFTLIDAEDWGLEDDYDIDIRWYKDGSLELIIYDEDD